MDSKIIELLTILQEECAEVTVEASKIKRFGMQPDNLDRLKKELGDLYCMIELCEQYELTTKEELKTQSLSKRDKLKIYSNIL